MITKISSLDFKIQFASKIIQVKYIIGSFGMFLRKIPGLNRVSGSLRVVKPLSHDDATMRQLDTPDNINTFN